jgi:hypothetical protein
MAARCDKNQSEIVAALRKIGCTVQLLHKVGSGCPDILCGVRGVNILMEIKDGANKLNDIQKDWHAAWKGQACVVRYAHEAVEVAQAIIKNKDFFD